MISARLGHALDKSLEPLAKRIKANPNTLTFIGFLITVIAALVLTLSLKVGGVLILFGGLFDMLDGAVARINGKVTAFGGFLDSVLDRYSDAFIFFALAWHFGRTDDIVGVVLSLGVMLGAILTSYARARAEGAGIECKVGLIERPERILLIAFGTIVGWLAGILWIMLFLTHITVVQRVLHVRREQNLMSDDS